MKTWQDVKQLAGIDPQSLLYENIQKTHKQLLKLVPKFEAHLEKTSRRRNVKCGVPAKAVGPNTLKFTFACGRKAQNAMMADSYYLIITFKPIDGMYDVETGFVDGWGNTKWREVFSDLGLEQLDDPKRFFARAKSDAKAPKPKLTSEQKEAYALQLLEGAGEVNQGKVANEMVVQGLVDAGLVDEEFLRNAGLVPNSGRFTEHENEAFARDGALTEDAKRIFSRARHLAGIDQPPLVEARRRSSTPSPTSMGAQADAFVQEALAFVKKHSSKSDSAFGTPQKPKADAIFREWAYLRGYQDTLGAGKKIPAGQDVGSALQYARLRGVKDFGKYFKEGEKVALKELKEREEAAKKAAKAPKTQDNPKDFYFQAQGGGTWLGKDSKGKNKKGTAAKTVNPAKNSKAKLGPAHPTDSPTVVEVDAKVAKELLDGADAWRELVRSGDNFLVLIDKLVSNAEEAGKQTHWRRVRHKIGAMKQDIGKIEALVKKMYGKFATGRTHWNNVLKSWKVSTRRPSGSGSSRRTPQDLSNVPAKRLVRDLRHQANNLMTSFQQFLEQGAQLQRIMRDGAKTRMPDKEAIVAKGFAFRDIQGAVMYGRVRGLLRRAQAFMDKAAKHEMYEDVNEVLEAVAMLGRIIEAMDRVEERLNPGLVEARKLARAGQWNEMGPLKGFPWEGYRWRSLGKDRAPATSAMIEMEKLVPKFGWKPIAKGPGRLRDAVFSHTPGGLKSDMQHVRRARKAHPMIEAKDPYGLDPVSTIPKPNEYEKWHAQFVRDELGDGGPNPAAWEREVRIEDTEDVEGLTNPVSELEEMRKRFTKGAQRKSTMSARKAPAKKRSRAAEKQLRGKKTTEVSLTRLKKLGPEAQAKARAWATKASRSKDPKMRKKANRMLDVLGK